MEVLRVFTVVIAEKRVLDDIDEYWALLGFLTDENKAAFCEWHTEKDYFHDMVPQLFKAIKKKEKWRAVIVCTEENLREVNPFDYVKYNEDLTVKEEELLHKRKMEIYDSAIHNPLVKLVARLSKWPSVTAPPDLNVDDGFKYYQEEMKKKLSLWESLVKDDDTKIQLPAELLCIARRTADCLSEKVRDTWNTCLEMQYSRFYDYNLYFDNMRYLVFDIADKKHVEYHYDYLRFLAAILIVANNETPRGCLSPGRIYRIDVESDKYELQKIVSRYDRKLAATREMLQNVIRQMQAKPIVYMSDEEIKSVFNMKINVERDDKFILNSEKCLADEKMPGIATDIPHNESAYWKKFYEESNAAFHKMLKSARRMVKRATQSVLPKTIVDDSSDKMLEEFQVEDIREFTEREERALMQKQPESLYDIRCYEEQMKNKGEEIKSIIETRLKMMPIILLSISIIFITFLGSVPFLYHNFETDGELRSIPLILVYIFVIVIAVAVFIILCILRHKLVRKFKEYNKIMVWITNRIEQSNEDYSEYLSCICNLMRANSIIERDAHNLLMGYSKLQLLKKHAADIQCEQETLNEILGQYIRNDTSDGSIDEEYYDYNYAVNKKYKYPLPGLELPPKRIVYMQEGNYALVSLYFINRIIVKREELYD